MVLWYLNNIKVLILAYVDCVPFSCLDSCSQLNQLILKNLILEFLKNMIRPPLI